MKTFLIFASTPAADDGGAGFIGFLIVCGFLYAIYKSTTKKKEYDVRLGGKITER